MDQSHRGFSPCKLDCSIVLIFKAAYPIGGGFIGIQPQPDLAAGI
jgi:hypothetical protein